MTSILILALFVLGISFACSLLEAVILSVTPAYVAVLVENKKRSGVILEHLIERIDRPLSAILTLNTITHTAGSALIALQVQRQFGDELVTVASGLMTIGILFISEIIPKSIGANHWKTIAPMAGFIIQIMILILFPFVKISEYLNHILKKKVEDPEVTREEVIMTAEISAEEGSIKNKESAIIKNLLMLDKMFVADIMTPRSVFFALDSSMTVDEVTEKFKPVRFSRVPVYTGSLDNIIGMSLRYRILEASSNDLHDTKVGELLEPIASVSEQMTVSQVLDYFIKEKEHLVLAVDEYGVLTGLVTLEDAVETLLGVEIVDEFDSVEDMRKFALEQWQLRKQKLRRN